MYTREIGKVVGYLMVYVPLVALFAYLADNAFGVWGVVGTISIGVGVLIALWSENQ